MNAPAIWGLGTATPPSGFDQREALELVERLAPPPPDRARQQRAVFRQSGVRRRGSAVVPELDDASTARRMELYAEHAPVLAAEAAREALRDADVTAGAITHLVTVSCTGFGAPGVDRALIGALRLPAGVARTHVGFMGCHAALNALRVARAFAGSSPHARVLVVCVELCTLHVQHDWHVDDVVAHALFADGAAAVVVAPARDGADDVLLASHGAQVFPASEDAMSWRIGDTGFRMTLSARVPDLIASGLPGWCDGWLAEHGLARGDVGAWAVHPGGPRVLSATAEALDLPNDAIAASRDVLARHGNMSSPTLLFVLRRLINEGLPRPWVALGFGPGLAVEAALLA